MIEIEPTELPAMQRQVADERAASKRWHDTHAHPQHGTECCADTSADTSDEPENLRFVRGLLLAASATLAVCAASLVIWATR